MKRNVRDKPVCLLCHSIKPDPAVDVTTNKGDGSSKGEKKLPENKEA